jgi:hypothetical protein
MIRNVHLKFNAVFLKELLSLFFIFLFSASFAQVKFSASVNNKKISRNDYLQIQFTVENAGSVEGITPPAFTNFTVISGPNQQSSMSNINGNIKQSIAIGFVLRPLSTGNFTIGSAIAKVDGKEYRSNPVSVKVDNSASSSGNSGGNSLATPFGNMTLDLSSEPATHQFDDYILRKGENVAEKIKRNLFIKIDVNKTSCYVGEPVIATYKLFTRLKSESNVLKTPSFNGFSVSELEMPDNYSISSEKYKGRDYNVYTLRKVQLYPLQSGTLTLDPVEVKNSVTFLKGEYAGKRNGDPFFDLLRNFADETAPGNSTEQQTVTVTCAPLNINVKPLPEENKPSDFKGGVGTFKINAAVEKNNITTDDAGAIKLSITGAGNIQMINAPNVAWPYGFEGFESKSLEHVDKFSVPMKGEKIFTYPFTVDKPGDYTIPAIAFSYFDIDTKSYKTLNTQPISLHVEKGTGNHQDIKNITGENKNNTGNSFVDILSKYDTSLIAAGAILAALILLFKRKKKGSQPERVVNRSSAQAYQPDPVEEAAFIIPANPLAEAEEKLSRGDAGFYKAVDVGLHKYLSEKLGVPVVELTKKKINERMDKCNVGVGTTLLVNSLLEDIELNLYAPASSTTQMNEMYEKASEVVSLLDKQIC